MSKRTDTGSRRDVCTSVPAAERFAAGQRWHNLDVLSRSTKVENVRCALNARSRDSAGKRGVCQLHLSTAGGDAVQAHMGCYPPLKRREIPSVLRSGGTLQTLLRWAKRGQHGGTVAAGLDFKEASAGVELREAGKEEGQRGGGRSALRSFHAGRGGRRALSPNGAPAATARAAHSETAAECAFCSVGSSVSLFLPQ